MSQRCPVAGTEGGLQMAVIGASIGLCLRMGDTETDKRGSVRDFASRPADVRGIGRVLGCRRHGFMLGACLARREWIHAWH